MTLSASAKVAFATKKSRKNVTMMAKGEDDEISPLAKTMGEKVEDANSQVAAERTLTRIEGNTFCKEKNYQIIKSKKHANIRT